MKLIRPFTVTPATLTSNITDSEPEYAATATYAVGAIVQNTTGASPTNRRYESLVANNKGNALTDPAKWLDLGPTNRWAMFDTKNSTATTNAGEIDVSLAVTGRADGLALFNLTASSVRVRVAVDPALAPPVDLGATLDMDFLTAPDALIIRTPDALTTVYDQTFSLRSESGITSWYDYFSEEIVFVGDLVLTDLPLYTDPTVTIEIVNDYGTTACGTCVVGQTVDIGAATYGAKAGITDYSRKTVDEFGDYTFIQRGFAKRASFKLVTPNSSVDSVSALLAIYRAQPVVWVGTDAFTSTWLFGWLRDWAIEFSMMEQSYLALEIEGLT